MTNETIASQLAHRTIRAYKDQPLTEEEVTTLMDVARHTATSSFLQSCTILHITDPTVREAIGAASGQPYWAARRATCSSSSPTCTATAASAPSRASPRRPWGR